MIYKLFYVVLCLLIVSCDLPDEAETDCNGVNMGGAYIDDCGYCSDGDTGHIPNADKDCLGICFGDATEDQCGICDDESSNDDSTCLDCNGELNGTAEIDECDVCGGSGACDCNNGQDNHCDCCCDDDIVLGCDGECGSGKVYDECNICGGSGISNGACDCDGNVNDECDVCDGPGFVACMCEYIPAESSSECSSNTSSPYGVGQQINCDDANITMNLCAPDCDGDNKHFSLSDLYGKVIFIEFTASW